MVRYNFLNIFCLLLLSLSLHADKRVTTIIMPRSVSVDAARELAGWQNQVNIFSPECNNYGTVSVVPEFMLSFKPERIAQCLFGDDIVKCKNQLTISGSQTPNRADSYWLADYFGLATDYTSKVTFNPQISNTLVDIDWYVGFDKWLSGLYVRMHAPLVSTQWNLNMCESMISTGSNVYDPGYFNASGASHDQLSKNFSSFISGNSSPEIPGLTFNKLSTAKMSSRSQHLFKLSDIICALGYNILCRERYHFGLNLRVSVPTGNRPTGEFLFEPIIGNGHHWELGGGLSTHITLWQDEDTQESAGIYCDANITHLFATTQCRSFDLCTNGNNSRYMLAQKMGTPIEQKLRGIVNGEFVEPIAQYQNEVTTIANLTTLPVNVETSFQADIAVMINYAKGKNSWGIGYSFWGRSCESLKLANSTTPLEQALWAIKGDSMAYGFEENSSNSPIPLSASESNATINHGTDFIKTGATTPNQIAVGIMNLTIDNPAPAFSDASSSGLFNPVRTTPGGFDQIRTSIQPIILSTDDIDINSARTSAHSHRLFSHFSHEIGSTEPRGYLSLGAQIEFGQGSECTENKVCPKVPCVNTALSLWGVWVKGGVSF